ncbi:type II toxin-antitoxin system prevent-host-death family antitoxin [Mumia sp. zg.B17]|uniref:type II toxin-antitoxin system Phd/YefM family antitoxin n=1 Tax=unclassified Mumia TaxID=2621872 RepID=UPI001C6E0EBC|nr:MULTISPECIES: type II toxin-antitoxin system prevent-host-death family antitoxin [unclassified Mumia]MBW9205326.1 type II toxin-antitoxin system prevent-host-death family antitoxin [Mumia sp. zg.B17]MBW9208675.1 type II toxin-antitoxin system prevent-host-death family antitoxin [Mumia sp. zg.B21]MDD9348085.1 type II toxin-antitoxin system prevent-host-death family antitoxin [Mumia sp.]
MSTVTMSQARAQLAALLDRVEAGEEITITRHGRAVARLSAPRTARAARADHLFAAADAIADEVDSYRGLPLPRAPREADADAAVRSLRADRDSW